MINLKLLKFLYRLRLIPKSHGSRCPDCHRRAYQQKSVYVCINGYCPRLPSNASEAGRRIGIHFSEVVWLDD